MAYMSDAPICTVGPSRPIVKPQKMPRNETTILPNMMRRESSELESRPSSSVAITCGMPLPSAPRKNWRVSQMASAAPTGVMTIGSQSACDTMFRKSSKPTSISLA